MMLEELARAVRERTVSAGDLVRTSLERPLLLRRALRSVLRQARPGLPYAVEAVIVVHDAALRARGGVLAAAGADAPGVRVVESPRGDRVSLLDAGLRAARHGLVGFLDDDDELYPNHFAAHHAAHALLPGLGASYTAADMRHAYGGGGDEALERPAPRIHFHYAYSPARHWRHNFFPIQAACARRELLLAHRPDPALQMFEDWFLWLDALRNARVLPIPVRTSAYRLPDTEGARWRERVAAFEEYMPVFRAACARRGIRESELGDRPRAPLGFDRG